MTNVSNQGKGNVPKGVQNQYLKIQELYNNYQKTKNNVNLEKTISLLKKIENLKKMVSLKDNYGRSITNMGNNLVSKLKTQMFSNNNTRLFNTNNNYKNIFNESFNYRNIFKENFNYKVNKNSIMNPGDFVFKANKFLYLDKNYKLRRAYSNYSNINIPENYSKYTFSIEKQLDPILELIYETPGLISGGRISVRRDDELIIREFGQELPSKYKYFLESDEEGFMFTVRTGITLYNSIIFQVPMILKKSNNIYSFTLKNKNNNKSKLLNHLKNN